MGTDDVKRWVMSEIVKSRYDMHYVRADDHVAAIAARDRRIEELVDRCCALEDSLAERDIKVSVLQVSSDYSDEQFREQLAEAHKRIETLEARVSDYDQAYAAESKKIGKLLEERAEARKEIAELKGWLNLAAGTSEGLSKDLATARAVNAKLMAFVSLVSTPAGGAAPFTRIAAEQLLREIAAIEAGGKVET